MGSSYDSGSFQGMVEMELEVEFMSALLDPTLLMGEGGYYLTSFSSAVAVIKTIAQDAEADAAATSPEILAAAYARLPRIDDMQVCWGGAFICQQTSKLTRGWADFVWVFFSFF